MLIISKGRIAADGKPDELQRQAQGHMDLAVELIGEEQVAKAGLESVPGVASVQAAEADDATGAGSHRFVVVARPGADPRAEIFRMAAQKGLVLTELRRERASLEDVFRTLTSGVAGDSGVVN